jgi:hypothetical protein
VKKAFHTTIKLLLILTIFIGLQGKVIIRYLEVLQKNHESEIAHSGVAGVKKAVIHCNLQCYTRTFKVLDTPGATLLLILIITTLIADLPNIFFGEKLSLADSVRLLPLRAPPAL